MAILDFKLNGERVYLDTEEVLTISDPDTERSVVAAQIGHWGIVLASVDAQLARQEAAAEHWFGKATSDLIDKDAKISEWKAKEQVKGNPEYLRLAEHVADVKMLADKVRAVYTAFTKKHEMMKAMADRERGQPSSNIGRTAGKDARLDGFRQNRSGR